ncbi:MAG: hypothetical protein HUU18_11100 [Phycisphaerales bacterium]|nr:hypothetical protein [Phycisphaerales bacterium]
MIVLVCRHPETKRMVSTALVTLRAGPLELVLADQAPRLSELGECCTLAIVGTEIGESEVQQVPRYLRGKRCIRTTPTILLFDPRSPQKLSTAGSLGYDDFAELPLSAQELTARLGLLLGRGARRRQALALTGVDLATGLRDVNKLTPALSILLENERGARSHILAASIRFDGALEIEQSHGSGVYAAFMSQMAAEIRGQCQPLDLVAWGGPDRITLIRGQVRPEECRPWLDALAAKLRPRPPEGAKATEADARLEFTIGAVGIDRARAVPGHDAKAVLARIDAALLQADCTQTLLAFLQDDQAQPCQAA